MQQYNVSDVSRLKAEFELQNAAAFYALHGLASGTAQHKIITARMNRMGELQEELVEKIGEGKAAKFVVETMQHGHGSPGSK